MPEYGADGQMKWERISPPLWWERVQRHLVADRHLPDGTRQHLVEGSVKPGTFAANAQIFGEEDLPDAEFSKSLSHLSA